VAQLKGGDREEGREGGRQEDLKGKCV